MATHTLAGPETAAARRLVSLDVFRGPTMAATVIVNNPGDWSTALAKLTILFVLLAPMHRRRLFLRV